MLDATAKVLLRNGEPVRMSCKAVETLLALIQDAGQVVTKQELLREIWGDRVVNEANLAQNIAVVRRTLGVEPGEPGYIQTFPGRGYRVIGPVVLSNAVESPVAQKSAGSDGHRTSSPPPAPPIPRQAPRRYLPLALIAAGVLASAAAAGWVFHRQTERNNASGVERVSPLSRLGGKEYEPALSPDSKNVAFVWEESAAQPPRIWLKPVGDSSPRLLTLNPGRYDSPAWSPDGKVVACIRFGDSATADVIAIDIQSRRERVIAHLFPSRNGLPYRHLSWSPDGQTLAIDDAATSEDPFAIFLVSLSTGRKTRLTTPDNLIVGDLDPRFSPDGKWVAFVRAYHRARQELFLAPVSGGNARQLTADSAQISDYDWLPDGQRIVFASNRDVEFRLWEMRVHASQPSGTLVSTGIYGDFPIELSVSKTAPALVYSELRQDFNIWRLNLTENESPGGRWTRIIASPAQDASPQYSPAGDKICFRSDRGGDEQLWVANANGSSPLEISRGKIRPSVGKWSPDEQSIVFNDSLSRDIYIATRGTSGDWNIAKTGAVGIHPVFSKDGGFIYAGAKASVVRIPVRGGPPTAVFNGQGLSFDLSPDGRFLYFVREQTSTVLWRLDLNADRLERVVSGLIPYCTSCWAVARGGVYYLGSPGAWSDQAVYYHAFSTGRDSLIVAYPEPLLPLGGGPFSLSPDERNLLLVRVDDAASDIMFVRPFR